MKVIARDSAFKYKGQNVDLEQVARELGVQAIVTGRVTLLGENIRISAELMDVRDRSQMWGEQYTRTHVGILQVQDEMVRQIAAKLRLSPNGAKQQQLVQGTNANPQAYELLLKGRFYQTKGTAEGANKAVAYFDQALAVDPNYALAQAALANSFLYLGQNGFEDPNEMTAKAQAAAERAFELDENLAEVHVALAGIRRVAWDWAGADREFKRAIDLSPNLATVRLSYAKFLSTQGRHDEAAVEMRRARELDPLRSKINLEIAYGLYFSRHYDESIEQYEIGLELDPTYGGGYYGKAMVYAAQARYREGIADYKEMLRLNGDHPGVYCYLGAALAKDGQLDQARAILRRLETGKEYVSPVELAVLYVGLGEQEKALAALERAYTERDSQMQYLMIEPNFDSLRREPRFAALMQKVGLPA